MTQIQSSPNKQLRHEIVAIRPKAFMDLFVEAPPPTTMKIENNIATIPIYDVLRQRNTFGIDYSWIKAQISKAIDDKAIFEINLEIDSPGGEVLGISELCEFIFTSRKIKPIIAVVKNMACSAAYWIASACSKIVLAGETTITGSIGVLAIHVDQSGTDQKFGIKITEIASGKYKNIASPNAPLSVDGQAYLKDQVDHLYSTFVQSIAKYRGMDINKVVAVADGREYIGSQAIRLGLADSIQTTIQGESSMPTLEELQQENERLKKELEDEKNKNKQAPSDQSATANKESLKAASQEEMRQAITNDVIKKAQAEERERMLALDEIDYGGQAHDIIMQAKRNGWSAEETSLKILRSQGKTSRSIREDLRAENKIITTAPVDSTDQEMKQMVEAIAAGAKQNQRK